MIDDYDNLNCLSEEQRRYYNHHLPPEVSFIMMIKETDVEEKAKEIVELSEVVNQIEEMEIRHVIEQTINEYEAQQEENVKLSLVEYYHFPKLLLHELFKEKDLFDIDYNYFAKNQQFDTTQFKEIESHIIQFSRICDNYPEDFEQAYIEFIKYLKEQDFYELNYIMEYERPYQFEDIPELKEVEVEKILLEKKTLKLF